MLKSPSIPLYKRGKRKKKFLPFVKGGEEGFPNRKAPFV